MNTYLFARREKRYKPFRKLLTLGFRSLNEHNLLETVLPRSRDLRDEVQEASCLGVLGEKKGFSSNKHKETIHFVLYYHREIFRVALFGSEKSNHGLFAEQLSGPLFIIYYMGYTCGEI